MVGGNRMVRRHLFPKHFFIIICLINILFCATMILTLSGTVTFSYNGFAIDETGSLYIGQYEYLVVYDQGHMIKKIPLMTSKGYSFTIRDNHLVVAANAKIYTTDLNGKILSEEDDRLTQTYNELYRRRKSFETVDGQVYKSTNWLGYYIIWNINKQSSKIIYQMPIFDYIVKVIFIMTCIGMVTYFIIVLFSNIRKIMRPIQ